MPHECPQIDCGKNKCCEPFRKVVIPAAAGDDSAGSPVAPQDGAYHNALVEYKANGALYMYASDGIWTKLYYTASDLEGMATTAYVDTQDYRTLQQAKAYTDQFTPRIASEDDLGVIRVGNNLEIDENGVLSANANPITIDTTLSTTSMNPATNSAITNAINTKAGINSVPTKTSQLQNDSNFATASDIPTVGTGTLTIQNNGLDVATFSANSDSNVTANIAVPVIAMTNVDPGEGGDLAAGHFIGVYQ